MEESFHIVRLSWIGFLILCLIIAAASVFYFVAMRRILKNYRHLTSRGIHIIFIDRLVILGILFVVSLSFFSVNPIVHGIILGFGLLLFYSTVSQIIKGVFILASSRISVGKVVELETIKGVVRHIGWTALIINSDGKSHILPYGKIQKEGISISDSSVSSRLYNVYCRPNEEGVKMSELIKQAKELLFTFPFISSEVKPQVIQEDDQIKMVFALSNDLYLNGLIQKLKSAGLETHIQK
jgi:hypothetical protein